MADQKTLNTRISLKIDTWANWAKTDVAGQGGNLVLKKGEIAFVQVSNEMPPVSSTDTATELLTNPNTVLFKVGDGKTAFKDLKWGSALAADVHGWAKESLEDFNTRVSTLITNALKGEGVSITGYVTDDEFDTFKTEVAGKFNAITNTDNNGRLDLAEAAIENIERTYALKTEAQGYANAVLGTDKDTAGTATVYGAKAAAAAAQAQADENKTAIGNINTALDELDDIYATDSELQAAKTELQGLINVKVAQDAYNIKVGALETEDIRLAGLIGGNTTEINTIKSTFATKTELNTAVSDLKGESTDTKDSDSIVGARKYTDYKVAALVDGAPEALNTLNELAAALKDNADIVDVLEGSIGTKANQSALDATNVRVANLENTDHTHTFVESELNKIVTGDVEKWNKTTSDFNTHNTNDDIHVTSVDKNKWNAVDDKVNTTEFNEFKSTVYTQNDADGKFATLTAFEDNKLTVKEATHAGTADNATNAQNAAHATAADSATKATQDGSGNVITATYETIANVNALKTKVEDIEGDYLKAADEFIIDCGSSTVNIF